MTVQMPKFNFASTISEKDLQEERSKATFKPSTVFQPGTYDLQIVDASYHVSERAPQGRSLTDPNWLMVKLTLGGINDKKITHILMVPTITDIYNKPGIKDPRIMFKMFQNTIRSFGINADVENVQKVLTNYFNDVTALIGLKATVDIGYEGPHAKYDPATKTYQIVSTDESKVLFDETFPDRDAAIAFAAGSNLTLNGFTKIKKFHIQPELENNSEGW